MKVFEKMSIASLHHEYETWLTRNREREAELMKRNISILLVAPKLRVYHLVMTWCFA